MGGVGYMGGYRVGYGAMSGVGTWSCGGQQDFGVEDNGDRRVPMRAMGDMGTAGLVAGGQSGPHGYRWVPIGTAGGGYGDRPPVGAVGGTWGPRGDNGDRRVPMRAMGRRGHVTQYPPPPPQDGRLSRAEILGNWQMFVGSQATNYGEDLERPHDEL